MSTDNTFVRTMAVQATQASVQVLAFSAFSNAIGMLMSATSMTELPKHSKATEAGIKDLRHAFGNSIVDAALKKVGANDDIVSIAQAVNDEFLAALGKQYSPEEVSTALNACPPGDMRCVISVVKSIHEGHGGSFEQLTNSSSTTQESSTQTKKITYIQSTGGTSKIRGRHAGRKVKDMKTGIVYDSLAAAGRALAPEYKKSKDLPFLGFVISKDANGKLGMNNKTGRLQYI